MNRFRAVYNCRFCGHKFKGPSLPSIASMTPEEVALSQVVPECPNCARVLKARGIDFNNPRAPAAIGQNQSIKAIDETAKIVMEDYHMTDLKSDVRPSETTAPPLAPRLQTQADNFFMGRGRKHPNFRSNPSQLGNAAIKGAYAQPQGFQPVANLHSMDAGVRETIRPQTRIVADTAARRPG